MLGVETQQSSNIIAKLRARMDWPAAANGVLLEVAQDELITDARAKASSLTRQDGSPSRLGLALLRTPSVDPLFSWTTGRPPSIGARLRMSKWAKTRSDPMFKPDMSSRSRLLNRVLNELGRL